MTDEIKNNILQQGQPETKPKPKHRFTKNSLTYLICAIISVVAICVIIVVIVLSLNKGAVSDDYFVSDDTKSVISLSSSTTESGGGASVKTHVVYTYDGDKVTSLKTYFEYPSEEAAAAALESYKSQPEFKNVEQNGKYIIVTSDSSEYEGLTADDVKQQAAAIEKMQNANKQTEENKEEQSEPAAEE